MAATVLGVVFARIDYRMLARKGMVDPRGPLGRCSCVALAMPQQLGAHRWIPVGELGQLQPSEFTKLALILWAAGFAERRGERLRGFWAGSSPGSGSSG